MSSNTISPKVQADHINQREEFKPPLSVEFRSSLNSILCWTHLLLRGRLDQSTMLQAYEVIEHNAKRQLLLLDQLLNWCLTSDAIYPEVSKHKQPNVDCKQFKQFISSLSIEFRSSLNSILCWTHLLREGQLDQSTTVQAVEVIEKKASVLNSLLDQLLNWHFTHNDHGLTVSNELSNGHDL